ncbi:MAG: DUF4080 domain-containing protein [Azonexus sp.]|nr:DUF4080 domain-containing protein [Azonexus sp.]
MSLELQKILALFLPLHCTALQKSFHPVIKPPSIVLTTLNAKYIHASLGLRYLLANMGNLRQQTALREFTIAREAQYVVEELLLALDGPAPKHSGTRIIGFGVYIWNVVQTTEVVRLLKATRPEIKIVLGGPEVSHEVNEQEITRLADHVITGWGDVSFARLCQALLHGPRPLTKVIIGEQPALDQIALPYAEYSDADLAHRLLYVEASRGCPFKCEFCLSALDKTAWAFDPEAFLAAMAQLYQRGARNFKFVDRTFNLKIDASVRILQFFLDRLAESGATEPGENLFLHFEVVPDHLPAQLKAMIAQFPPGVLQFEVGIQSFNVEVQQRISRRQDNAKAEANLAWLLEQSNAHLHTDLIFGLPGETLESFGLGFDSLYGLRPHEIQLGILKRLRGTPIIRHTGEYGMVYDENPPYSVRETSAVDAAGMQRFSRFARYWDMFFNSGRFKQTLPLLLDENHPLDELTAASIEGRASSSPFHAFLGFSDWLWQSTAKTNALTPEALVDALFDYLCKLRGMSVEKVQLVLLSDYLASGARGSPQALRGVLPKRDPKIRPRRQLARRQEQHQAIS